MPPKWRPQDRLKDFVAEQLNGGSKHMVHRLALFIGGVGAAAVLALALGMGGLLPAAPTAADTGSAINGGSVAVAATPQPPQTVIDRVYVEPTPAPVVVHVNKPARTSAPVANVSRPPAGERERERGDGGERGDD
jgi:hypothetical protein